MSAQDQCDRSGPCLVHGRRRNVGIHLANQLRAASCSREIQVLFQRALCCTNEKTVHEYSSSADVETARAWLQDTLKVQSSVTQTVLRQPHACRVISILERQGIQALKEMFLATSSEKTKDEHMSSIASTESIAHTARLAIELAPELNGRIFGRGGQHIKALEKKYGVTLKLRGFGPTDHRSQSGLATLSHLVIEGMNQASLPVESIRADFDALVARTRHAHDAHQSFLETTRKWKATQAELRRDFQRERYARMVAKGPCASYQRYPKPIDPKALARAEFDRQSQHQTSAKWHSRHSKKKDFITKGHLSGHICRYCGVSRDKIARGGHRCLQHTGFVRLNRNTMMFSWSCCERQNLYVAVKSDTQCHQHNGCTQGLHSFQTSTKPQRSKVRQASSTPVRSRKMSKRRGITPSQALEVC